MTVTDPLRHAPAPYIDIPRIENGPDRSAAPAEERDAHLLRLSLDLQLDALLLVLGASAVERGEGALPWRRWLSEDVEAAWELASAALGVNSSLPPMLSPAVTADQDTLTADLLARYESMASLLRDLVTAAAESGEPDHSRRYRHVRSMLDRCRSRVEELRTCREAATATVPPSSPLGDHEFLPGELLG